MQFISVKPLIEKFANRQVTDAEVAPYFFGSVVLETAGASLAFAEASAWAIIQAVGVVFITCAGILYLRKCNGGNFEDDFLKK